ncbi:histidinol-phosphate transaminase [Patescibacteria group bacterium]|nr:histidinol-phosphate transaminase [Patescibacteria group bacterium]MBU4099595.1 histidinol-phosphate transaminase [Patescibacteria group bacterium]
MKKIDINQLIRSDIAQIAPYVPGTSAQNLAKKYGQNIKQLIKLNANENPYGVSPFVKKALKDLFYNYYPTPDYPILRLALSKYTNTKEENIIVGSGSDELIYLLLRAVLLEKDKVIICPPTFGIYEIATKLSRGIIVNVPTNKNFTINLPAILKSCSDEKVKVVFFCNPNNPTGNLIPKEEIIEILKTGKLVIVDEAYYEFSKMTLSPLLPLYENLIILRTLSKWAGLAGLRIGYGIMSPKIVNELMKIKSPFNINIAAEGAALATFKDISFAKQSIQKIISERERVYKRLKCIQNLQVYKSYGNYIFVQTQKEDYKSLRKAFEKNKIALRYYPAINNGIRITIGKPKQNNKVLAVLFRFCHSRAGGNPIYKKKYAFIDRDGTLIFEPPDTHQVDSIEKLNILEGAIKGLKMLKKRGFELIMVTNQDGLGTSSFPKNNFQAAQNKMLKFFKNEGIIFNKIFICPHLRSAGCNCRKPRIGLVSNLFNSNVVDKKKSFVCGDRISDKQFAQNLGIKFISMKTNANFYDALQEALL